MTFYDFAKHQKTVSYTTFWSFRKRWTKYLIKPVVYWYFWGPFRKKALKSIKKALGFPLKVDYVLRLRKTSKTFSKTTFWSFQKSWTKYLIKPVVYWSFWGPFPKRAPKVSISDRFYKVFCSTFLESPKRCFTNGFLVFCKARKLH